MTSLLTRLKKQTRQGGFARHVGVLAGGTALGQAIAILASPFITRLYTPEDFGVLTLFTALLTIALTLASGRYEIAIPLADSDQEARHLRGLSLTLLVISTALLGLTLPLYAPWLASVTNTPELATYLWLLPLGLLAAGFYQVLNFWALRAQQFAVVAQTKITQLVGQVGTQLALGFVSGPLGLLVGTVLGRTVGSGSLLRVGRPAPSDWNIRGMGRTARKYLRFPLYTSWGSLFNVLGTQSPPFLLSTFFSTEVTGFFGLTMRVLALPTLLVGQAVGEVFYPRAAKLEAAAFRTFVERTASALLIVSAPIFITLSFLGPQLFTLVFGAEWTTSGVYAQYLALWLLVSFVSSPLSTLALIFERNRTAFIITLFETVTRVGGLWLGGLFDSPRLAVALFALAGLVITTSYLAWTLSLAGSSLLGWLAGLKSYLAVTVAVVVLLLIVRLWLPPPADLVVTAGVLAVFTGGLWLTYFLKNLGQSE